MAVLGTPFNTRSMNRLRNRPRAPPTHRGKAMADRMAGLPASQHFAVPPIELTINRRRKWAG
jgi:hypothetical protein